MIDDSGQRPFSQKKKADNLNSLADETFEPEQLNSDQKEFPEFSTMAPLDAKAPMTLFGRQLGVSRLVAVLHVVIFLYSTAFWIQIGVNPFLTKKLGVDPTIYGYLETTFAIMQLCGGPLFGRFGDIYGGRSALLLAYASSTAMYLLLWIADSIPMLFVAKMPSLFMHSMQGGQMLATDLSSEMDRADALGKLGVSYGVGMVLGPMIGGFLTQRTSPQVAALAAAMLTGVSIVMVYSFVPTRTKKLPDSKLHEKRPDEAKIGSLSVLQKIVSYPKIPFLLVVRVVTGVPLGVFQTMFSIVAIERFQVDPKDSGLVLSYVGLLSLFMQGFGVGFMTRRFSDDSLLRIGAVTLIPYYLGLALMTSFYHIYFLIPFVVFAMAIMNVVVTSSLTKRVEPADTGAILGINMATNSLVRTVAPTLGGILYTNFGYPSFGLFGLVTTSGVLGLLLLS